MLDADQLVGTATSRTGLADFGAAGWRDGLDRLVEALNGEADLTDIGTHILGSRLEMLLANRLRVVATVADHPEITDEEVDGPLVIIGLPRTGTTALSNLLAADPRIRSVRLWESSDPVPPPETEHQHDDPRIEAATQGLELMYETFPRMRALHFQSPTGPTECQDLLGMNFRTAHFDGMARVPSYTEWVVGCDMTGTYAFHRRALQLLQWHCPPRLWHLKTPVHMLALDALRSAYPSAKFLWTHRDPAAVLGSVCSLIAYTRSWASDRDDAEELGRQQLAFWAEAVGRALDFRDRAGEGCFADVNHAQLQSDPVGALAAAYEALGLDFADGRGPVEAWARDHRPGAHGVHEFALDDFDLDAGVVRARFAAYLDRFPTD
jgi:Sulfotransferase family